MNEPAGKMYALAIVLTIMAILAVILRFYARSIKKIRPSWDDYLVVLALVMVFPCILSIRAAGLTEYYSQKIFAIGTAICMFVGAAIGGLGRDVQVTPDGMPIFDDRVEVFLKIVYISQLTQTLTLGSTKLAVVFFYRRIFETRTFSIISWVMIGLTTIWTIAFFAANLLQCLPISANWSSIVGNAQDACIKTDMMFLAQAWSDVLIDVVILSMPITWIWKLQITPMRKFFVVLIFQLGTLVVCAGIAKLVIFYKLVYDHHAGHENWAYLLQPTVDWPMIESSLGIIGACLPLMRPIFTDTPAKDVLSTLHAKIALSSLRSNTANTSSKEYAKLEAGIVGAPQNNAVDGAQAL